MEALTFTTKRSSSYRHLSDRLCRLSPLVSPGVSRLADDVKGGLAARNFTLFKIPLGLSHLIRHVGKTDDLVLPGLRQRIEGSSLHFYCQNACCATVRENRFRLPKRCIGRPTGAYMQGDLPVVPVRADHLS